MGTVGYRVKSGFQAAGVDHGIGEIVTEAQTKTWPAGALANRIQNGFIEATAVADAREDARQAIHDAATAEHERQQKDIAAADAQRQSALRAQQGQAQAKAPVRTKAEQDALDRAEAEQDAASKKRDF